jgi:hypothetical protein
MSNKDLQLVLDEMFASEREFTFEVVRAWQKRYPQFSQAIAEAVSDWREFEFFALEEEKMEELPLSKTAENAMKKALTNASSQTVETITDLRELAEKRGVERESLITKLGVSETIMRKIERRNLKEIPGFIKKKIAEILNISLESLEAFLNLPTMLPKAAKYKSKNAPRTQPKQSFTEAVKNDPELNDEQKRVLLKLE